MTSVQKPQAIRGTLDICEWRATFFSLLNQRVSEKSLVSRVLCRQQAAARLLMQKQLLRLSRSGYIGMRATNERQAAIRPGNCFPASRPRCRRAKGKKGLRLHATGPLSSTKHGAQE